MLPSRRDVVRRLRLALGSGLLGLLLTTAVHAQDDNPPETERSYVIQYVMVAVLTGAALTAMCRPGPRAKERSTEPE